MAPVLASIRLPRTGVCSPSGDSPHGQPLQCQECPPDLQPARTTSTSTTTTTHPLLQRQPCSHINPYWWPPSCRLRGSTLDRKLYDAPRQRAASDTATLLPSSHPFGTSVKKPTSKLPPPHHLRAPRDSQGSSALLTSPWVLTPMAARWAKPPNVCLPEDDQANRRGQGQ